jgi:small conductance mechanosensitive channel
VGNMDQWLARAQEVLVQFGLNLLAAIIIIVIGRWLAKAITRLVKRLMDRHQADPTLINFTASVLYYTLLAFVFIAALNRLGVQTASIIAVLGAAGLAVGLAIQGSLANFAAGVLMLIFRPFKVGDYIEAAGFAGTVEEIQLLTTTLVSADNTVAIIPNGNITVGNILNYTRKDIRRIDQVVGISYSDDVDRVRRVILNALTQDKRVLSEPAPRVIVLELADSSVNLGIRPWVKTENYWPVYFDLYELVKQRLDAEGISIPFPQRDVHMFQRN